MTSNVSKLPKRSFLFVPNGHKSNTLKYVDNVQYASDIYLFLKLRSRHMLFYKF